MLKTSVGFFCFEGDYAPIYFRSNKNQDCPPPSEAAPSHSPPERSGEEEGGRGRGLILDF